MDLKKTVGARIRKIRDSRNLTQENVADELDITHSAYAKIERGTTDPQVTRLYSIAKVLKVDVTEFFQDQKSLLEDYPAKQYGFASKGDIDELKHMFRILLERLEKLEKNLPVKRTAKSKKKGS